LAQGDRGAVQRPVGGTQAVGGGAGLVPVSSLSISSPVSWTSTAPRLSSNCSSLRAPTTSVVTPGFASR
jgi:hypothetical protein